MRHNQRIKEHTHFLTKVSPHAFSVIADDLDSVGVISIRVGAIGKSMREPIQL